MPDEAPPPPATPPPTSTDAWVDLSAFTTGDYDPGRGPAVRVLWWFTSLLLFESGWFLLTGPKATILRWFGARLGRGVVIKPHVRIKHPWLVEIGDHCWIGQDAWIDSIAPVRIGDHVCVSQRAYLCTGSHDYRRRAFDLRAREIVLENGSWVGAGAIVLGGVTLGANAILSAGSVATRDVPAAKIAVGNPATPTRERQPVVD